MAFKGNVVYTDAYEGIFLEIVITWHVLFMRTEVVPIGVFDSGVGGLSVWKEIIRILPQLPTHYFADQKNVPYGVRSPEDIQELSARVVEFLRQRGCRTIVVACNSASAAALQYLRGRFPDLRFVGMEPAIKPALSLTASGVIAVWATPATFKGGLYENTLRKYAQGALVVNQPCPGLVELIEEGAIDSHETRQLLSRFAQDSRNRGADVLVLGCTHYPLVKHLIAELAPDCGIIDPAIAVALQVKRVYQEQEIAWCETRQATADEECVNDSKSCHETNTSLQQHTFYSSGDMNRFMAVSQVLLRDQGISVSCSYIDLG